MSITGDIRLSPTQLRAAGAVFPLKVVSDLSDYQSDLAGSVHARVMAVTRPMDPKLLNGNTLGCGRGKPVRWIVLWQSDHGKSLNLDTYAGKRAPKSINDPDLCGTYAYFRK
jgi:hypothetical protein